MKFTFPIHTLSLGGAQRMLAEITNGLVDRGHDVTILMPSYGAVDYPIRAKLLRLGNNMDHHDYPFSDVIVSNFHNTVAAASTASLQGKGVHVRFSLCYEPPFLPDNHQSLPTYHATKHVIVLSKWQKDLIKLMHGIDAHIVPIGLSHAFANSKVRIYDPVLKISSIARRPEGGFSSHREQDYLIQELQRIKRLYPFIQIRLFCPSSEFYISPALQELARSGEFQFLTPKDDTELCYHYSESDIFVCASSYDAGSLPGLEAMRCGAALVTIYSGGNMDYCKPQQNCLMSFRYQNRLGQDIERLIHNPQLRHQLASQGEIDSMVWTWDRSVDAFEAAIRKIFKNVRVN